MNRLANKHVSRLGYPTGRGGAIYYVSDQEGLCQMAINLAEFQYQVNGGKLTSEEKEELLINVKFERDIYNSKIAQHGVPKVITDLLNISIKSDVIRYCNNIKISEFDLYLFIQNSYLIDFTHESKFPEYIPEHLVISDTNKQKDSYPISATKKLVSLINERRIINVHMFNQEAEWHCFYFSYNDIENKAPNHWKYGSHIHYISFLWPSYTKEQVWDSFDKRKTSLSGNRHIRFIPYDYPENGVSKGNLMPNTGYTPGGFAFDISLAAYSGPLSTPSAHIATRGCWITKVSLDLNRNNPT